MKGRSKVGQKEKGSGRLCAMARAAVWMKVNGSFQCLKECYIESKRQNGKVYENDRLKTTLQKKLALQSTLPAGDGSE
eukprot:1656647-Pleurochrysis_carterae.AAC.1